MSLSARCTYLQTPTFNASTFAAPTSLPEPAHDAVHLGAYDRAIKGYVNRVFFQRSQQPALGVFPAHALPPPPAFVLNLHVYWADVDHYGERGQIIGFPFVVDKLATTPAAGISRMVDVYAHALKSPSWAGATSPRLTTRRGVHKISRDSQPEQILKHTSSGVARLGLGPDTRSNICASTRDSTLVMRWRHSQSPLATACTLLLPRKTSKPRMSNSADGTPHSQGGGAPPRSSQLLGAAVGAKSITTMFS
ncbi:hypothetical protein V8E36_007309 [Tilletia maclaganii]